MVYMATLAKKQLLTLEMRACIAQSVREVLEDPDFGLELTENFKKKLRAAERTRSTAYLADIKDARKEVKAKKVISQEKLFKRLGL